jgi:hypothetical protein
VGISLAVGGEPGFENRASYRRIDVRAGDDVDAEVAVALASTDEPLELSRAPRFARGLAFLSHRASDTFLVSNLGRVIVPQVDRVDFYPVARGRSAIAVGAVGVLDGESTVCLRARDLGPADAEALLDTIVLGLELA